MRHKLVKIGNEIHDLTLNLFTAYRVTGGFYFVIQFHDFFLS
jgi:hypothetical protein